MWMSEYLGVLSLATSQLPPLRLVSRLFSGVGTTDVERGYIRGILEDWRYFERYYESPILGRGVSEWKVLLFLVGFYFGGR